MAPRPPTSTPGDAGAEADRFDDTPHPRETFALFGHEETETALLDLYRSGCLPQACLIGGPPGIGKATLAWRLARFVLANPNPEDVSLHGLPDLFVPRDHKVSRQLVALSHPDLFLLRRKWDEKRNRLSTEIRVDDVRDAIRMFRQSAGHGGYRICVLDCAEDLNAESANALLKLVEEPPPRSLFLIVAQKPDKVLPTIRSRCQKIPLKPLNHKNISKILVALGPPWSAIDEDALGAASSAALGSVHDALRRIAARTANLAALVDTMLNDLPRLDWRKVHAVADQVASRDGIQDFDSMLVATFDWLDREVRRRAAAGQGDGTGELAAYAQAWEKVARDVRQVTTFNLDKRPLVLSLFGELAAAARSAPMARDRSTAI